MSLKPIILCGGAGSRLWPLSREAHPKPFIRLGDDQSLLQKAFIRAAQLPGVTEVLTVTNRDFVFQTEDELRGVNTGHLPLSYLLEPVGRNTAAAVAAATLHIAETNPEGILLVLAADHLITDQTAFERAVLDAIQFARQGFLVTFGVQPTAPDTGYGYIEADGNQVKRFVEKPDQQTAQAYLESGCFFWNSGMFCFAAKTMIEEMSIHCPEILDTVRACLARSQSTKGKTTFQRELDEISFSAVPEDSIDKALMEKSRRVAVVPCNIGWSDIGSWIALCELAEADENGNRIEGEALLRDVENCAIRVENGRLVGAVGLRDLIIVDTPDALLVVSKDHTQDVKQIYSELKSSGHETHKFHRTVHRPWGAFTVLEEGDRYKIKRIVVKPGASLSLQMHHHRSEHWIVVSGMAKVTNGNNESFVATNESTYIPAGDRHRVSNPGVLDLVMIEVQSGEYLGEDDIVRFEDTYGRVKA